MDSNGSAVSPHHHHDFHRKPQPQPHLDANSTMSKSRASSMRMQKSVESRYRRPRQSIFKEIGLDSPTIRDPIEHSAFDRSPSRPLSRNLSNASTSSVDSNATSTAIDSSVSLWTLYPRALRLTTLACILLVIFSTSYDSSFLLKAGPSSFGARAGFTGALRYNEKRATNANLLTPRQNTDTNVCSRWSQQSALVNGTIYVFGGHATTEQGQTSDTWTNDFFTVDVTKTWDISSPAIQGLPRQSGLPPVSNGYLWNSYSSLFLYGGEFSDSPVTSPVPFSLWEYDIGKTSWVEHKNPKTSEGNNSDSANQPVQRAAEGAGVSVPGLGRGYYFAGHLDEHTTVGWSNQVARQYLKALVEFTFPASTNDGVKDLSGGKAAGDDGVWRNITQGGIQDTALFPNRADSALVYVPGYGEKGILVSMGGGTNESFTQMNIIDIFDVATSTWYRQSTNGAYPTLRVNPCAVAASAPDGSSTNIYMYGGQNLIPYKNQTQFGDMWILTVPSFTWIQVDTSGQSVPMARVGHTCNIWDGQIVVIGGYNTELAGGCDSGFYVFDATRLTWQNKFNAVSGGNPQNQQIAQDSDPNALGGSYGYQVPEAVQSVIGGKGTGGATITAPAQSATAGPLATGKPITYTVTDSNGAVITETGTPSSSSGSGNGGPNVGAIVAGVVAGVFAILAAYLGFCAWVYRRQLALYKNHVAMTQKATAGHSGEKAAFLGGSSTENDSSGIGKSTDRSSAQNGSIGAGSAAYSSVPNNQNGIGGNSIANSSVEDLAGEPSFIGVLLNPRRSLRVVNRD